jgi:hypothetical protein
MQTRKNVSPWLEDVPSLNEEPNVRHRQCLIRLNARLERDAYLSRLNETQLERRLSEFEETGIDQGAAYGLTLARINELALLCAGNYADQCEIRCVGDLLFNPRRLLVHVAGLPGPVVKKRHMGLTEQFADVAGTRMDVVAWFKEKTVLEIKEKALLPHLYERLRDSGIISRQYLDSVNDRMKKIAAVIGLLASNQFLNGLDFHQWLCHARAADRNFIESRLCRFDTEIFFALGRELEQVLQIKDWQSTVPATYGSDFEWIEESRMSTLPA